MTIIWILRYILAPLNKNIMVDLYNLQRFLDAQDQDYLTALQEIKNGKKYSHWIWYIFPQLVGLGSSYNSEYYGIKDLSEAKTYLENDKLRERLEEISSALLDHNENDALKIMGSPDHGKLKSSMTLFSSVPGSNPVFENVLIKYFKGWKSRRTLELIRERNQ